MQRLINRWICLGIGIGLVLAGTTAVLFDRDIPDSVVIRRAEALGMVFRDEVVAFTPAQGDGGGTVVVCIPPGMNKAQVAGMLSAAGVIARAEDFEQELSGQNGAVSIPAGVYRFNGSEDTAAVVQKISSGDVIARLE